MYLVVAKSAYQADNEVFKKHFAKSIATDMVAEKVAVVQIAMTKLVTKIPPGQIRSADKLREMIQTSYCPDVAQYLEPDTTPFKFINPDNLKMQLKSGETEEEK